MSPLRHAASSRDAALERRRQTAWAAALGGLAAVGAITGVLAVNAAATSSSASTPAGGDGSTGSVGIQPGDATQPVAPQPQQDGGTLNPPQSAPGRFSGGGPPQAATGGSPHR